MPDGSLPVSRAAFDRDLLAALPALRRFCLRLARNHHDAEDLAQSAIAAALGSRAAYAGAGMSTWLCAIARHRHLAEITSARRRHHHVTDADMPLDACPAMQTEGQAEARLILGEVLAAIAAAPQQQRDALVAIRLNGATHAEHAAAVGCTVITSRTRLHRAELRLRGNEMPAAPITHQDQRERMTMPTKKKGGKGGGY